MPRSRLTDGSWQLEVDAPAALREKIKADNATLLQRGKRPLYGAKTGANDVFIIDRDTRDRLIKDPASSSLIHPLLTGDDLCRWGAEFNERYLIFTNGGIDIEKFPAIHSYLQQFKTKLQPKPLDWVPTEDLKKWPGRKSGSYAWYELQDTVEYSEKFLLQKIIYPEFSQGPKFTFDLDGRFLTNKCFMIQGTWADLAVLNSRPIWYFLFGEAAQMRGGQWRLELRTQYIENVPLPTIPLKIEASLASLAQKCQASCSQQIQTKLAVLRRIPDLCPPDRAPKFTNRLREWWKLDFKSFRAEIKKAFKDDIPLKQRNEWENFLREEGEKVRRLTAEIEQAERDIDAIVYKLFGLTPDDIALLESSLAGQY
jgi:hypothetical protein